MDVHMDKILPAKCYGRGCLDMLSLTDVLFLLRRPFCIVTKKKRHHNIYGYVFTE